MTKLDPRTKLILVASLTSLGVIYREVTILFLIFLLSCIIVRCAGVELAYIYKKMKRLLAPLFCIICIQSIFTKGGEPLIAMDSFVIISSFGLEKGLEFLLRMAIIIFLGFFLTTLSQRELTQALVKLNVPYELAFMSTLGVKFVPIFSEEFVDSLNAIMFRGIDVQKLPMAKKLKVYTYILTPVVTNSILRGKELAIAMEMRGFRVKETRTHFLQLQYKRIDYFIIGISGIVFLIGILWRFL